MSLRRKKTSSKNNEFIEVENLKELLTPSRNTYTSKDKSKRISFDFLTQKKKSKRFNKFNKSNKHKINSNYHSQTSRKPLS